MKTGRRQDEEGYMTKIFYKIPLPWRGAAGGVVKEQQRKRAIPQQLAQYDDAPFILS